MRFHGTRVALLVSKAPNYGIARVTLDNVRLWDWRALQDTLRQIQAIRTYYDFPDIDIDRYEVGGQERQMMVAARELNLQRLPESSQNWINEKLIYTHGYGITMNLVNGFTPEGLPQFILRDMPVQSTVAGMSVTRPEVYFGELTNGDVSKAQALQRAQRKTLADPRFRHPYYWSPYVLISNWL